MMKKNRKRILLALILLLVLAVAVKIGDSNRRSTPLSRELGIEQEKYVTLHEQDDHGGFHGDGLYHIALDCSANMDEIVAVTDDWPALPLPDKLRYVLYRTELDSDIYAYDLAEQASIPYVQNGCYYFHNRHSEAKDAWDTDIFGKYSFNFSIAIFDSDANILYFMAFDT